jgi:hypothetical protein
LEFENPLRISKSLSSPDLLEIVFLDSKFFIEAGKAKMI